uniref:OB_NTP_bind domain-containing protein n=1 Tax=Caenorhabditis japonica TaxID=281687 RepID=A0A8R1EBK3_CAEJA
MKNQVAKTDFSDHLMLIRLCTEFCAKGLFNQQGSFCREHFLNFSTMRMANGTRRQLLQELLRAKVVSISGNRDLMTVLLDINYNSNAESWPMIQAAIAAGCYPSVGVMPPGSRLKKVQTFNERPAGLHPSSILKKQVIKLSKSPRDPRLEYVAFQELYQAPSDHALLMKMVTVIPSITALLFTGPIRLSEKIVEENDIVSENGEVGRRKSQTWDENNGIFDTNLSYFEIDTWYAVRMEKRTLTHLLRLRHKFMHFFLKGIQDPAKFRQHTLPIEEQMLHIVRELLESEHARYGFSKVVMPESAFRGFAAGYENSNGSNQNHNNSNRQGTRAPNNWRAPGRGEARDFRGKPNLAGESSNRQSTSMQRNFQQQYQPPNPTLNPQHENSGNNRPFRNGHPQQGGYNHFEHTNFPQRINYGYGRNAEIWTPQNFPHNANATGPSFQGRSSHE